MRQPVLRYEISDVAIRLVDEAHTAWLIAQAECAHALRVWFDATAGWRDHAHQAYRAALDREEAAARDLERLSVLAAPGQVG
jgi:hypothetical protein